MLSTDSSTTLIYTLSLHDALPICSFLPCFWSNSTYTCVMFHPNSLLTLISYFPEGRPRKQGKQGIRMEHHTCVRSEEHTSELQSLRHLVCRLLLEKKKQY